MKLQKVSPACLFTVLLLTFAAAPAIAKYRKPQTPTVSQTCTSRTKLHCEIYGSGDPILCIHGLGGSLYSWRKFIGQFPNNQLVLIDLLGAGQSPKPHDDNYSILTQRDLLYDFIEEHDFNNLTIVGNSYGGAVSLLLAIKLTDAHSTRFKNLVLIDSAGYREGLPTYFWILHSWLGLPILDLLGSKRAVTNVLRQSYAEKCRITKPQIEAYAAPLNDKNGKFALSQMAKQALPDNMPGITDRYKDILVPTLILWGDSDRVIPLRIGTRLRDTIPHTSLQIISSAGHIPQEEEPAATICEIRKFLEPGYSCTPPVPSDCPVKKPKGR
ncbi:MAG TPA: alpha/beta hydrolase [Pyrinomonadaceae bacterium]|nr:alpha/beta hydrolase [Pyrinomonadaceae bacterium]